jgi:S1-C subfamily serine protease
MNIARTPRFAVLLLAAAFGAPAVHAEEVQRSVFKIFSSKSPPNMFRPWHIEPPTEVTGSGVLIEDGRILTNAHVVSYAQQIYVQPYESSDKLDATIEFLSQECDLATLRLDEPDRIRDIEPVPLADELPAIKAKINVLGYPTGGDTLSVTEGVVSRIEYALYNYDTGAIRIQVDAAINPGNSGGPGIVEDKITGIVFSRFNTGENIGYLIPAEVVRHFLRDWTSDGKYDGFPKLDIVGSTLENPSLRDYLGLESDQTGIVIHRVNREEIRDLIKPWDVVAACDGIDIDNDGRIPVTEGVRTNWAYLLSKKDPGSKVKLDIIRKGEKPQVELSTITERNTLVKKMDTERPRYFVYGGIVFSPVTSEMVFATPSNYFAAAGVTGRLLVKRIDGYRERPDDEIVVTCSPAILQHKLTKGYNLSPLSVVTHVNDVEIRNLRQMVRAIKDSEGDFVVFRFEEEAEEKIVLDKREVAKYQDEILRNNNIPSPCSEDLRDIWP